MLLSALIDAQSMECESLRIERKNEQDELYKTTNEFVDKLSAMFEVELSPTIIDGGIICNGSFRYRNTTVKLAFKICEFNNEPVVTQLTVSCVASNTGYELHFVTNCLLKHCAEFIAESVVKHSEFVTAYITNYDSLSKYNSAVEELLSNHKFVYNSKTYDFTLPHVYANIDTLALSLAKSSIMYCDPTK